MAGPGFDADYSVMNTAVSKIEDSKNILTPHAENFPEEASLEDALPSTSDQSIKVPPTGLLGPDIDKLETLIAQSLRGPYQDAVDSAESLLKETGKNLEKLKSGILESIQEYRERDADNESALPDIDPSR